MTGSYCEIDVDECIPIPNQPPICAHGGKCVNTFGSYHCQCAPGYKGEFCDDNVDDCQPNPCYNGGSCIDGDNSFQCSCTEGNNIFLVLFRKLWLILVIPNFHSLKLLFLNLTFSWWSKFRSSHSGTRSERFVKCKSLEKCQIPIRVKYLWELRKCTNQLLFTT